MPDDEQLAAVENCEKFGIWLTVMPKTLTELIEEAHKSLEKLQSNPYCPERIYDDVRFEPVSQPLEIDHDAVMSIFDEKKKRISEL